MTQHTPGPWFASPVLQSDDGWEFCTVGPFDVSHKPDPNHYEDSICDVSGINHDAAANARLIAAAPELLERLREMLALHDEPCPYDSATTASVARALLRRIDGSEVSR